MVLFKKYVHLSLKKYETIEGKRKLVIYDFRNDDNKEKLSILYILSRCIFPSEFSTTLVLVLYIVTSDFLVVTRDWS